MLRASKIRVARASLYLRETLKAREERSRYFWFQPKERQWHLAFTLSLLKHLVPCKRETRFTLWVVPMLLKAQLADFLGLYTLFLYSSPLNYKYFVNSGRCLWEGHSAGERRAELVRFGVLLCWVVTSTSWVRLESWSCQFPRGQVHTPLCRGSLAKQNQYTHTHIQPVSYNLYVEFIQGLYLIYIYNIYMKYKELARAVMEAEQYQPLLSALDTPESWLCNSVQLWRSENQECQEQEKIDVLAEAIRQEGVNTSFLCLSFYSGPEWIGGRPPTRWGGQPALLSPLIQTESHPETSS